MKTDEKMILKNIFVVLFYVFVPQQIGIKSYYILTTDVSKKQFMFVLKFGEGGDKNLEWYKWEGYIEMK